MEKAQAFPRGLFWDTNISRLDLKENRRYIIERILEFGDEKAVSWLLSNYSRGDIRETLRVSRNISPKSRNYWLLILGE